MHTLFWKKLSPFRSENTSCPSEPRMDLTSLILMGPVAAHVTDACAVPANQWASLPVLIIMWQATHAPANAPGSEAAG